MNTKKVKQAFDKVVKELLEVPSEEFKGILKKEKGDIAHIFLEGKFVSDQDKSTSDEELLGGFPDAGEIQSKYINFFPFCDEDKSIIEQFYYNLINNDIDDAKVVEMNNNTNEKETTSVIIDTENTPYWMQAA